jgi:hypothetical protein
VLLLFEDAVPKKRGPKTDVLEALLKRVDGLEAKLKEKNAEEASPTTPILPIDSSSTAAPEIQSPTTGEPSSKRVATDVDSSPSGDAAPYSPGPSSARSVGPFAISFILCLWGGCG